MRFDESQMDIDAAWAIFEVDPDTFFSEQVVARKALAAFILKEKRNIASKRALANFSLIIGRLKPETENKNEDPSIPQETMIELNPQQAETLAEALVHFRSLTHIDTNNSARIGHDDNVAARTSEDEMAEKMLTQLEKQYGFNIAYNHSRLPMVGYGAILSNP